MRKASYYNHCTACCFPGGDQTEQDENALAIIRNIFAAKTRDFITAIDDSGIIILRELQPSEDCSGSDEIAHMLRTC
ncbi:MAG: hypothetical protein ACLUGD_05070 [Ruminococcus sp.]